MGIDIHALNLLRFAHKNKPLGRMATLGRQSMAIPGYPQWSEQVLTDMFGTECVESYDVSDYEGCTYIEDFNKPLSRYYSRYDTVLDSGSMEHIFDIKQCMQNLSDLCAIGGQILHSVPANNLNGHGFYQFNSDLFYSYYCKDNGYTDTIVFYVDHSHANTDSWYLSKPMTGVERSLFNPAHYLYLHCRTVKVADVTDKSVQASDYQSWWGWRQNISPDGPQIVEIKVSDLLK
jgi:hypothetical protein